MVTITSNIKRTITFLSMTASHEWKKPNINIDNVDIYQPMFTVYNLTVNSAKLGVEQVLIELRRRANAVIPPILTINNRIASTSAMSENPDYILLLHTESHYGDVVFDESSTFRVMRKNMDVISFRESPKTIGVPLYRMINKYCAYTGRNILIRNYPNSKMTETKIITIKDIDKPVVKLIGGLTAFRAMLPTTMIRIFLEMLPKEEFYNLYYYLFKYQ